MREALPPIHLYRALPRDKPAPSADVPSLAHVPEMEATRLLNWSPPGRGEASNQNKEEKQ